MSGPQKKPGWGFWGVLILTLPIAYVASFGPACWWFSGSPAGIPKSSVLYSVTWDINQMPHAPRLYWSIGWLALQRPDDIGRFVEWCATLRIPEVALPFNASGASLILRAQ